MISLGLEGACVVQWEDYVDSLREAGITFSKDPVYLEWIGNKQSGSVTTSLAYLTLLSQHQVYRSKWWHIVIWKVKVPQKLKCFMWLSIRHKILTWYLLQQRGFHGPSRCILCEEALQSTEHLFCECARFHSPWMNICFGLRCM